MICSTRARRGAALLATAVSASLLVVTAAPVGAAVNTTGELSSSDPTTSRVYGEGSCGAPAGVIDDQPYGRHYDVYPFYVTQAEQVTVDLRASGSGVGSMGDVWLNVYCNTFDPATPGANVVAGDDDSGSGLDARLTLSLQPGVQYFAVATSYSNGETGTYALSMTGSATEGTVTASEVPRVSISTTQAGATEGGEPGAVTFTRAGDRFSALLVRYSVSGTATSGVDFQELSGVIQFPYGELSVTLPIQALSDELADDGETVVVNVEFGEYDRAEPRTATVTIGRTAEQACADVADATYADVPDEYTHAESIDCITAYGLAEGYDDGTFKPGSPVTRAQNASFVARLLGRAGVVLPAKPADAFADDEGSVHELAIDQLAELGILDGTTGEDGDGYRPVDAMRRDDMAQILFNAYEVATGGAMPIGADAFTDDERSDNEGAIDALAAAGVVEGTGGGLYAPDGSVNRGQFATFFAGYLEVLMDSGESIART